MSNFERWGRVSRLSTIAALALIALGAGACGHGIFSGSSSSSSGGGGGGSTTSRSVYVTNSADGKLSALADSPIGTLSSPATIAAGAVNGPLGLALTPPGSFAPVALYVANPADNTIHQFTVTSTGNLSALATIAAGTEPQQIAVTPSGSFAYAINLGASISEYLINSASGQLSVNAPSSIVTGLTTPVSGAASDSFLYVTDPSGGLGLVLTFTIASGGALSFTSGAATGGSDPGQIAIDSVSGGSTWVFVADASSGLVSVFQVVGSALSLVTTIPTGGAAAGMALATTSGGTFLYVANPSQDLVTTFSFNTATGVLALFATTAGFSTPTGLAVDNPSSATTLFVTNNGAGTVTTLTIASTGALTAINSFSTENPANGGSGPEYIAVTP